MPYDTSDMARLSSQLATINFPTVQPESLLRAAISRSYYACFLAARDSLWGVDGTPSQTQKSRFPRSKGSHDEVLQALGAHPGATFGKRSRLKSQLAQLKAMRVAADYRHSDTHSEVTRLFAQYRVATWQQLTNEALALCSQVLPEMQALPRFT